MTLDAHPDHARVVTAVPGTYPRVAIVCDTASFRRGGEAAMPLKFFRHFLALGADCILLAHDRTADELRTSLGPEELRRVTFFGDTKLQLVIGAYGERMPRWIKEYLTDTLVRTSTERRQRLALRELAARGAIDAVFQPVPISPRTISLIGNVGVPVFVGPLNGDMAYPPGFKAGEGFGVRTIIDLLRAFGEVLHYVFPARAHAAALFVANERTRRALPRAARRVPTYSSYDATIEADIWSRVERAERIEPSHFVYVGRLVSWKNVDAAVRAVHRVGAHAKLTIVGEGDERPALERLAKEGPAQVVFAGFMSHEQLLAVFRTATALVLPSLREAGGNVCLEALAAGVPVIATRWGGAVDVVQDGVDGILVEPTDPEALVDGIARAMRTMCEGTVNARRMGLLGRERVLQRFEWRRKARDYLDVFAKVVAQGSRSGAAASTASQRPGAVEGTRR
jgi:glycosyltransferase involved in cell wall biosynthesis